MEKRFTRRLIRLISLFIFGFLLLFVFRIFYGFNLPEPVYSEDRSIFNEFTSSQTNIASKEYKVQGTSGNQVSIRLDQKYEKIASINTRSEKFDDEESIVRRNIEDKNALIQFEQKSGNTGNRRLHLVIGVPPEQFDSLYESLAGIGIVLSRQITKKDKTNEYKELNAQKASLEKIRTSLINLKSKGGKIEEFINLENRILDIEKQLQDLGVNLGDFDEENEFCTVKFSLQEYRPISISWLHRIKVALEWTVRMYLGILGIVFLIALSSYLILLVFQKIGGIVKKT